MVNEAKDSQQLKKYYVSSSSVGESDVSNHGPPPPSNGGDDCEGHNTFITGQPPRLLTWSNVNLSVVSLFLLHGLLCRSTASLSEPSFFPTLKKGDVKILKNVWGMAGNEITAILGPSGAGAYFPSH